MNRISIQTPNQLNGEFLECNIITIEYDANMNTATVRVKGISSLNVTTCVMINDFKALLLGEKIKSLFGYFLVIIDCQETLEVLNNKVNYDLAAKYS